MGHSSKTRILLSLLIALAIGLAASAFAPAQDSQEVKTSYSTEEQDALKTMHTILMGGPISTWFDYEYPLYDPVSTVKGRLEEVGFRIVFDPNEPHDAILRIEYAETPSGTFRSREQGTVVTLSMTVYHLNVGIIAFNHFVASPSEMPTGSLYWDTIGNLEGDPLYFYQAQILKAWGTNQTQAGTVLMRMMLRPYTDTDYEPPYEVPGKAFVRRQVRLNAIREIGNLTDPQAQETLLILAKVATPEERTVAVQVLGDIGDPSFLTRLSQFAETDQDPNVQHAAQEAIRNIELRQ